MLRRSYAVVLVAICILVGASLQAAEKPIKIALIPDGLTPEERAPLGAYLTKVMGRPVTLVVPEMYSDTLAGLSDGSIDFACLGAIMYIKAHAKDEVVPLVQRATDIQFHTVFITGAESAILRSAI